MIINRVIKKGDFVIEYMGELIDMKNKVRAKNDIYTMELSRELANHNGVTTRVFIEPLRNGNIA